MSTTLRILLLALFGTVALGAQDPSDVFRRVPSESGLSQNSIFAILQDRRGFLWVGTAEGLNRYDGYDFVAFRHDPEDPASLSDNRVQAIFEDRAGTLWVGTLDGASRFDERTGTFERVLVSTESNPLGSVDYFLEDETGLLAHSASIGWCRIDRHHKSCLLVPAPPEPGGSIWRRIPPGAPAPNALLEDRDGALWLGGDDLYRYEKATGNLQRFPLELTGPTELKPVRTIYQDRAGTIWVGTLGGLYKRDPYARHFSHRTHDENNPNTLSSNLVSAIYEDSGGLLWIGTIGGGLNRLDPRTNRVTRFRHDPDIPHSLSNDVIWAIHEDPHGRFWIATDDGLNELDIGSSRFRVVRCPGGGYRAQLVNTVASIEDDGPDALWIGQYGGGVARVDTRTLRCRAVAAYAAPGGVLVHADPSGPLWIGMEANALHRIDTASGTSQYFPLTLTDTKTRRTVWAIHRGRDGMLWLGTDIGLARFDPSTGSFTRVWDSTLPSSVVYAILEDSAERLWLSTNRGICYFDAAAPDSRHFGCFGPADGLRNNEFVRRAAFRTRDGRLYFGGLDGLVSFDPEDILRTNPIAPPVVLTHVQTRARDYVRSINAAGLSTVVLSHKDYSFTFGFVALSFTNSAKNRYSYMLAGIDPDWIGPSANRLAQYTNVPPGTYVFRVKGSNNDGVWNEEGASLRVIITPPFWQRWWFRALIAVAFAGALVMVHRYRVKQVLAIERIRQQVATDLHDDVGAGLSQVAILSEVAKRQAPPAAATLMTETADLARALRESMSDIVWAVDPRRDRLADLVQRMRQIAFNALEADGLVVEFYAPADDDVERVGLTPDRRRQLLLIFKEAITNTARHARASRVRIDLVLQGAELRLAIHDDGRGFDPNATATGHGLASLSHRASELGGRLTVDTAPGRGTRIELTAPLR